MEFAKCRMRPPSKCADGMQCEDGCKYRDEHFPPPGEQSPFGSMICAAWACSENRYSGSHMRNPTSCDTAEFRRELHADEAVTQPAGGARHGRLLRASSQVPELAQSESTREPTSSRNNAATPNTHSIARLM